MSSINRISTEVLKRQGIQKITNFSQNRFVDKFINGDGSQHSLESGNISLNDSLLENSVINTDDFFRARDYFLKNGISESSAETMSKIVNDMAVALGVSVASFLYNNSGKGIMLALEDYAFMNAFRPTSNRVSALTTGTYNTCLRGRDIIA